MTNPTPTPDDPHGIAWLGDAVNDYTFDPDWLDKARGVTAGDPYSIAWLVDATSDAETPATVTEAAAHTAAPAPASKIVRRQLCEVGTVTVIRP